MFRLSRIQIDEKNQILNIGVFRKINIFIKTRNKFSKVCSHFNQFLWLYLDSASKVDIIGVFSFISENYFLEK